MTTRTNSRTIRFLRPFKLSGLDGEQPAGSYVVETDEEALDGLSFAAYRRTATYLVLERSGGARTSQLVKVDPVELLAVWQAELATLRSEAAAVDSSTLSVRSCCRGPMAEQSWSPGLRWTPPSVGLARKVAASGG
jgi:hypothetical protein